MKTNINIYEENNILIARINGEVDNFVTKDFREQIDYQILNKDLKHLIIDFQDVSFVDSSGIGFVIGRYNLMKKENGIIFLSGLSDYCEKIFMISGIYRLIKCYKTLDIAKKEMINHESYRIKI